MNKYEVIDGLNRLKNEVNISSVLAKYALGHLHIIPKLTPDEFIAYSFTSNDALNDFLTYLQFDNFQAFCSAISIYLEQNLNLKDLIITNDRVLIHKFHNQILNSLELNYFHLIEQDEILIKIIEKFKIARKIYFFTNHNSSLVINQFIQKLSSVGFKMILIDNYQLFEKTSQKISSQDVCLVIFDEFQNRPLVDLVLKLNSFNDNVILVAKHSYYELKRLNGLKWTMDYWAFPRVSTLNVRQFSLNFLFELLFQKILETIDLNHQKILQEFLVPEN